MQFVNKLTAVLLIFFTTDLYVNIRLVYESFGYDCVHTAYMHFGGCYFMTCEYMIFFSRKNDKFFFVNYSNKLLERVNSFII